MTDLEKRLRDAEAERDDLRRWHINALAALFRGPPPGMRQDLVREIEKVVDQRDFAIAALRCLLMTHPATVMLPDSAQCNYFEQVPCPCGACVQARRVAGVEVAL